MSASIMVPESVKRLWVLCVPLKAAIKETTALLRPAPVLAERIFVSEGKARRKGEGRVGGGEGTPLLKCLDIGGYPKHLPGHYIYRRLLFLSYF